MNSQRLRILFICPYVPASNRLRPNGFLAQLSKRHRVTAVFLVQPAWEGKYINELSELCDKVIPVYPSKPYALFSAIRAIPSKTPTTVAFFRSPHLRSTIDDLFRTQSFDIAHVEYIRSPQNLPDSQPVPVLFDAVDSLSLAYSRRLKAHKATNIRYWLETVEGKKYHRYERNLLLSFSKVIISSPVDRDYLAPFRHDITVIPNGVDLDYFRYSPGCVDENALLFVGKMNYYANVEAMVQFSRTILPLIRLKRPATTLNIVGWNPSRNVRSLLKDPNIRVIGSVPDLRPYLSACAVFIAPLFLGAGIQNKVLQAMASGIPVVATSMVADSLGARHREHLLVADDPDAFARCVLDLQSDAELSRDLCKNARQFVEANHSWDRLTCQLEEVYASMLA